MNYQEAKKKYADYNIIAQGAKDCVPFTQLPKDWEKREADEVIVEERPHFEQVLKLIGTELKVIYSKAVNGTVTLIFRRKGASK